MKSIGYVLSTFPVLSETFVSNEIRAMQLHGHRIQPIACFRPDSSYQPDDEILAQRSLYLSQVSPAAVFRLCLSRPFGILRAWLFARKQSGMSMKSLMLLGSKVAVMAKSTQCQHLHAHFALHTAAAAIVASRILNLPVSFVGHGFDIYASPADLALKLQTTTFNVAVCQAMADDFRKLAPNTRVEVLPCGIELDKFQFNPQQDTTSRLLFIGRLTEKKGLLQLVKALKLIPKSLRPHLDIIGDGEQKAQLTAYIEQQALTDYVTLHGAKTSDWICRHGSGYSALVAPFRQAANGDRDTGPLVLKEAMALGVPVITTAFMGCVDIVDEQTGYLVAPDDVPALANAIQTVLELSAAQRLSLVTKARLKIESHFSVLTQCRQLSAWIGD